VVVIRLKITKHNRRLSNQRYIYVYVITRLWYAAGPYWHTFCSISPRALAHHFYLPGIWNPVLVFIQRKFVTIYSKVCNKYMYVVKCVFSRDLVILHCRSFWLKCYMFWWHLTAASASLNILGTSLITCNVRYATSSWQNIYYVIELFTDHLLPWNNR